MGGSEGVRKGSALVECVGWRMDGWIELQTMNDRFGLECWERGVVWCCMGSTSQSILFVRLCV